MNIVRRIEETPPKAWIMGAFAFWALLAGLGFWKAIELIAWAAHHVRLVTLP